MKYFAYGCVVIQCEDNMPLEEIVARMRIAVNGNSSLPITIMIEDMEMVDEIDYKEYLDDLDKNLNWGHFEGNNTGG
jgi:hypothetical protein